jgi:hypothetical protein
MGIPDDLCCSHHQLEEDRPIEKDQLPVSVCLNNQGIRRTLKATSPVDREAMVAAAMFRPQDRMRVPNETQ